MLRAAGPRRHIEGLPPTGSRPGVSSMHIVRHGDREVMAPRWVRQATDADGALPMDSCSVSAYRLVTILAPNPRSGTHAASQRGKGALPR
jgi:hypothetical protein